MRSLVKVVGKLREVLSSFDYIAFAILFGSMVKGHSTSRSDVDIAIYVKDNLSYERLLDLIFSISSGLRIPEDKVDILVLSDDTPYELRYRVLRDGVIILVRDENLFKRYRDKSISLYLDFKVFEEKLDLKGRYLEKLRRLAYG